MSQILVIAPIILGVLQAVSVILHLVHLNKLAALDDKVVVALKQIGIQPPSS